MSEPGAAWNASVCRIKIRSLETRLDNLKPTSAGRIKRQERLKKLLEFWQSRLVYYHLVK